MATKTKAISSNVKSKSTKDNIDLVDSLKLDETVIRRTVSIPVQINGDNILALIEIGGKLWNKDLIYQKFFEVGVDGVKAQIEEEIIKRGGTKEQYTAMIERAKEKIK